MKLNVTVERRLSSETIAAAGLTFEPVRYSHRAIGGPYRAEVQVTGNAVSLWQFLNHIGAGLRIWASTTGDQVWWGYIHEMQLTDGLFRVRVSLDDLANRVRVAYTYRDPATNQTGGKTLTEWLFDGTSIATYGLKELTYSTSGAAPAFADNLRSTLLEKHKLPTLDPPEIQTYIAGEPRLILKCRGWWDTLDWRYHTRRFAEYGYRDMGDGGLEFGYTGRVDKVAQGFTVGTALIPKFAYAGIKKTGSPTDNYYAAIYSNYGGTPNAALYTSADRAGTALKSGGYNWSEFRFANAGTLLAGTLYYLVVDRDGSDSTTDYYVADLTFGGGYTGGSMMYYNGSAWTTASVPASDMPFLVSGEVVAPDKDTALQIQDIIQDYGTVAPLNTAVVIDQSGITHSTYRDGENTALYEINELLELGTSNNRRLLARVRKDKTVEIYEQPASTSYGRMDKNGDIYGASGGRLLKETCPVAYWMDMGGIIPDGALIGYLSSKVLTFIEESEYTVETGELRTEPAERVTAFDFLRIRNG